MVITPTDDPGEPLRRDELSPMWLRHVNSTVGFPPLTRDVTDEVDGLSVAFPTNTLQLRWQPSHILTSTRSKDPIIYYCKDCPRCSGAHDPVEERFTCSLSCATRPIQQPSILHAHQTTSVVVWEAYSIGCLSWLIWPPRPTQQLIGLFFLPLWEPTHLCKPCDLLFPTQLFVLSWRL